MYDEGSRAFERSRAPFSLPSGRVNLDGTPNTDELFPTPPPPPPVQVQAAPPPQPFPNQPGPPSSPFAQPQPPAQSGPSVTVTLTGAVDSEEARKAIGDELIGIAKGFRKGPSSGWNSSWGGGKLTYTFTPVDDPRAFADLIKCGKVTKVDGSRIEVVVTPPG